MLEGYGSKKDSILITKEYVAWMPDGVLKSITDRLPAIIDYNFDKDTIAVIPVREKWFGMYFGKFSSWEPKLGIVFISGLRHIRIYFWKYTFIIGSVAPQQIDPVISTQEVLKNEIESRPRIIRVQSDVKLDPESIKPGQIIGEFRGEPTTIHNKRTDGGIDLGAELRAEGDRVLDREERELRFHGRSDAPGALVERLDSGEEEVTH
jgi:hypothetical protein